MGWPSSNMGNLPICLTMAHIWPNIGNYRSWEYWGSQSKYDRSVGLELGQLGMISWIYQQYSIVRPLLNVINSELVILLAITTFKKKIDMNSVWGVLTHSGLNLVTRYMINSIKMMFPGLDRYVVLQDGCVQCQFLPSKCNLQCCLPSGKLT